MYQWPRRTSLSAILFFGIFFCAPNLLEDSFSCVSWIKILIFILITEFFSFFLIFMLIHETLHRIRLQFILHVIQTFFFLIEKNEWNLRIEKVIICKKKNILEELIHKVVRCDKRFRKVSSICWRNKIIIQFSCVILLII